MNAARRRRSAGTLILSVGSLALAGAASTLLASAPAMAATSCGPTPAGFPSLGGAGSYAVFGINAPAGNGSQTVTFSNDTVQGDVGIASGVTGSNMAPSTINGNVYVDSGGSFSGPGVVNGTVLTGQDLSSQRTDAINASATAAAETPNFTSSGVTTSTTYTGVSGNNVLDVNGDINLNNASLTLAGPADAFWVVNVTGSLTLVGTGGIAVGGSVPASNLLINMTGTGAGLINTHVGNTVVGTLLGPNAGGSLDGAFDSLILGENVGLLSGVGVTQTPPPCPPPASVPESPLVPAMAGAGLLAAAVAVQRRRRTA